LAKRTGKVKLLAAVMNNMIVPEKIILMRNPVNPVTRKIQCYESNEIGEETIGNMNNGHVLYHPTVADDGNAESDHIFGNIGDTTAKAADHIIMPDSIEAFAPSPPFFK
jgi:hypothetical protein